MPTTPQLTIVKLSERARIFLHQMLDRYETPTAIARSIAATTHERIAASTIAAYAKQYAVKVQAKKDARQRATNLVTGMIRQGADVSESLQAAFYEAFNFHVESGTLKQMNPLLFEAADRRRIELDLHKKQVSLAERRVQVFEQRLHLDRKKAQALTKKLERKARTGHSVTPQEIRQIREIYGVYDATDRDGSAEDRSLRNLEPSHPP